MVWYSQEARAYALMVLLCVLALGFFVRALAQERWAWLVGWAACSAAALATHYFAVFPLAAEAALAVDEPASDGARCWPRWCGRRSSARRSCRSCSTRTRTCPGRGPAPSRVTDQLEATGQSFLVGISWTPVIHRAGVAVLALGAVAAVLALVRRGEDAERRAGLGLAALALVTVGAPVVISLAGTNYLAPRNVLYAWPILALLVAARGLPPGAGRLSRAGLLAGCAVCVAIVVAVPLTPALQRATTGATCWRRCGSGPARGVVVLGRVR